MTEAQETLRRIVTALNDSGAEHMVVGSLASTFHGEPRTTRDIDIVVEADADSIARFVASLPSSDWYVDADAARDAHSQRSMFNVVDMRSGWKVDVICLRASAFASIEFSRRVSAELLGVPVFVATAEDTILAKLSWCRDSHSERQLRDAAGIVTSMGDQLDKDYLDLWTEELELSALWQQVREHRER